MNSYFLYWDLSWIVIFLFTFQTSLATKSNQKTYLNKRNISSIVCYEKEPTHIPIEKIKKELDELAEIERNINYVRTSKLSGGPNKPIRYYYIDVAAIADYSLLLQFGRTMSLLNPNITKSMIRVSIREEIANMFFGAKRVYLKNQFSIPGMFDFKIVLNLVDIILFESEKESFITGIKEGDKVDASKAMELLNKYAGNRPYDHMTLLTGNDLMTKMYGQLHKHIIGIAHTSFMCVNYKSISIIDKPLEGLSMLILVHQIGHALGANHDGQNNCRAEDEYLMRPKPNPDPWSKTLNKWKFSECSKKEIASNILWRIKGGVMDLMDNENATDADIKELSKYMYDCFTKKIPIKKSVPDVSRRFRGSESELKLQCAFTGYSDAEGGCYPYLPSPKSCLTRFCKGIHHKRSYCAPVMPYRGTSCGLGKVCENGYCRSIEELRKEKMDFSPNLTAPAGGFEGQTSSYCSHDYGLALVIMTLLVCGTLTE